LAGNLAENKLTRISFPWFNHKPGSTSGSYSRRQVQKVLWWNILWLIKKYRTNSELFDNITYTALPGTDNKKMVYHNKK